MRGRGREGRWEEMKMEKKHVNVHVCGIDRSGTEI